MPDPGRLRAAAAVATLAFCAWPSVGAQTVPDAGATSTTMAASPPAAPQSQIPAGIWLTLEITQTLHSGRLKRGDRFPLRLAAPLVMDGVVLLPAGVAGVGEVIHVEQARSGGKAGELLLAARYLEMGRQQIRLRSFRLGANGTDRSVLSASLAPAIGVFSVFVHGGEIEVPAGTQGRARTVEDTRIEHVPASSSSLLPGTGQPMGR